jgi:hypothetical protein
VVVGEVGAVAMTAVSMVLTKYSQHVPYIEIDSSGTIKCRLSSGSNRTLLSVLRVDSPGWGFVINVEQVSLPWVHQPKDWFGTN